MNTQWIRVTNGHPTKGQPVWYRHITWPASCPSRFGDNVAFGQDATGWLWQPADVPPAPADNSESAFEAWWRAKSPNPVQDHLEHLEGVQYAWAKSGWEAGVAWHKNQTKE